MPFTKTVRCYVSEAESMQDLLQNQPTLLRLLPRLGLDAVTGMDFLCLGGVILSFAAMVTRGLRNSLVFGLLWVFYLSLFQVSFTYRYTFMILVSV